MKESKEEKIIVTELWMKLWEQMKNMYLEDVLKQLP
jgi:hypothetical protein